MYTEIVQSHRTNDSLTRVKIVLCYSVFNTLSLSFITRKDMTRLKIITSRVKPLHQPEPDPPRLHISILEDPALTPASHQTPLRNHLLKCHCLITRKYIRRWQSLLTYIQQGGQQYDAVDFGSHFRPRGTDSLLPPAHHLSCGLSPTSLTRGSHPGASWRLD